MPSLDTPTCQKSTRVFNERASAAPNAVVLVVSADLPFAMSRFCGAEGLNNVVTLSTLRDAGFHRRYGVDIVGGPLEGSDRARGRGAGREQPSPALRAGARDRQRAQLRSCAGGAEMSVEQDGSRSRRPVCAAARLDSPASQHGARVTLIFDLSRPGRGSRQYAAPPARAPDLPADAVAPRPPLLPEVSELDAVRHYTRLSQQNFSIDTQFYPLGSCTMKYNPRACNSLAMLGRVPGAPSARAGRNRSGLSRLPASSCRRC